MRPFNFTLQGPGLGLELLATGALQVWPDKLWIAYLLFVVGTILIVIPFIQWFFSPKPHTQRWLWRWKIDFSGGWPPARRLIPLREATVRAYEKTQGTLPSEVAERFSENGVGIHSWYAVALIGSGEIPVFGLKPPSTKLVQIPTKDFSSCSYKNDANDLVRFQDNEPLYTNLSILKSDFKSRLREIKTWDIPNG